MTLNGTEIEIIGLAAGFFTSVSGIPQLVHVVRRRSANDLSLTTLIMFWFGSLLWVIYGLLDKSLSVSIWNAVGFVIYCALIGFKVYGAKKSPASKH
jgi:MtN3 and saliva related transmembrane protein